MRYIILISALVMILSIIIDGFNWVTCISGYLMRVSLLVGIFQFVGEGDMFDKI